MLQQITTDEALIYWQKAREFVNSTGYYQSTMSVAVSAIAEYMASLDGKTLRKSIYSQQKAVEQGL